MTTNIDPEELTLILAAIQKVQRERDELRALNERLVSAGNVDELRAEVERLRAALAEIAEAATPYPETLRRIAHDALASHKE